MQARGLADPAPSAPRPPQNTANRPGGIFTIGAAGRCLSKALVEGRPLDAQCRTLVLAAAPKDSRAYLRCVWGW